MVIIPKTKKTLAWTFGLGLAALLVAGIFINPPKAQSQAASGGNCRVGIAIDRSGSVAISDPANAYIARAQIKSLIEPVNFDGGWVDNRVNKSNVELTFWSFGTAASGFTGRPPGSNPNLPAITHDDYPFYSQNGNLWINTGSNTAQERDAWAGRGTYRGINDIPFIGNRDALFPPGNWAPHPSYLAAGWSAPFEPYFNKKVNGYLQPQGGINYGDVGDYLLDGAVIPSLNMNVIYRHQQSIATSTNWEAGLGRNDSDWLPGWGGVQRARDTDVIILFTDAIEPEHKSSWYNNPGNKEPNAPSVRKAGSPSNLATGQQWAIDAANYWRNPPAGSGITPKQIVVVSYDPQAKDSDYYKDLVGSNKIGNIIPLGGNGEGLKQLGPVLKDVIDERCSEFAAKPYLRVYGNDARAGARFGDTVPVCDAANADPANINTFARNLGGDGGSARWVGAAVQHAVSATGNINEFFSAGRRNNSITITSPPNPIEDLSFGNFDGNARVADFGGESGMERCIPDYFEIARQNNEQLDHTAKTGFSNITSVPFSSSDRKIVDLYQRDVHIVNNITYPTTSWDNVNDMYSYTLIVKGADIYIRSRAGSGVTQLNGTYIAIPECDANGNNCEGGRIFTCSTSGVVVPEADNGMRENCNRKLTINGAFIARQVRFHRTLGDVERCNATCIDEYNSTDNAIAEVFDFSQETYLSMPESLRKSSAGRYDSIVSLPPIL